LPDPTLSEETQQLLDPTLSEETRGAQLYTPLRLNFYSLQIAKMSWNML
jgi:hypothetical protein